MILKQSTLEKFYSEIFKPVASVNEFAVHSKECLAMVAEELSVAKIECVLNSEASSIREAMVNMELLLFEKGMAGDKPEKIRYNNSDGGTLDFQIYAVQGHAFTEEEKEALRLIADPLYVVLSFITLRNLLGHAVNTDLTAGVANLAAFDGYVMKLIRDGQIDNYHAIYMNIRNFKYVNRVLTYHGGNDILKRYANAVQRKLNAGELISRIGGDNFAVLVRNENVDRFCEAVSNIHLEMEMEERSYQFDLGATMGISHLRGVKDMGDIMLRISVAFQLARQKKSNGIAFYSDEVLQQIMQEKEVTARFEKAIAQDEFAIYYQPKIRTKDSSINGAEALVRWIKDGRVVPPGEFIPILEKDGSICKLDFYVLERVCKFLSKLRDEGKPLLKISVNFSKRHMLNENLAKQISEVVKKYDIPHKYIEIELTESEDFEDYAVISKVVNDLKAEGICTSIDDFGTGFSSLNMLRLIEVDLLKIDRAFIPIEAEFDRRFRDLVMFKNIVRMAKELGIQIVAEGVETKEQYDYISTTGCDMIQGYYFDKPLPEKEFLEKLEIGKY